MQFPAPVTPEWISEFINADTYGKAEVPVSGINELHNVTKGDIVFVDHPKYYEVCLKSEATFIIINKKVEVPKGKIIFVVEEPFESYLKIVTHFRPFEASSKSISDSAVVGKTTMIMPHVFIGNHVQIGEHCIIHPNVTIYDHCEIGNHVVIHAGTTIGSDAFYFNTKKNRSVWFKKMHSCGNVVIEDNVEIGANCTIDRGVSATTRIGRGTKIDNLVHIAHEVTTGSNCLIAAQVGIAGSTKLGDGVTLWGQVGVNKTLTIADGAVVLAQSGVPGDLEAGKTYWGSPTEESMTRRRELVWIKRIPLMWEKLNDLSSKLK